MPSLNDRMHLDMFREHQGGLYGLQWGDPDERPDLKRVRDHWLLPHVWSGAAVLEIGPGGGRWTRYLVQSNCWRIYAVDYHIEMLDELRRNMDGTNMVYILNNGDDFPDVPTGTIDFVFSFGTFVHLENDVIERYLRNMRRIVSWNSQIVLQYSDKRKPAAMNNRNFSVNTAPAMRKMVEDAGYRILEEDNILLNHSNLMRLMLL